MQTIINPFYARRLKRVATLQETHHRPVHAKRSIAERQDASEVLTPASRFVLGEISFNGNATPRLRTEEVLTALRRHANGDWGDLLPEDALANEMSLQEGVRLFSAYGFGSDRFWFITDFALSVTAVLMPDD
jgi:hypothetical protein